MITINIQSFFIGVVCSYALSCVLNVWGNRFIRAKKTIETEKRNKEMKTELKSTPKPYKECTIGFTSNSIE